MTCWSDMADRQRQADEADATLYNEEVDRRAAALMEPGASCDPTNPANFKQASVALCTDNADEIEAYWWGRAEMQAISEVSLPKNRYRNKH